MKIRTLLAALLSLMMACSGTITYAADAVSGNQILAPNGKPYVPLPVDSTLGLGAPLMKGLKDNNELADLIHASLEKDSSGNSKLDEARCRLNGSCATPNTYLHLLQAHHPNAGLTSVSQLEKHIRALVMIQVGDDEQFYSSRMVGDRTDDTSGFHRPVAKGEWVYEDTQTGDFELFGNCGNVIWPVPLADVAVVAKDKCVPTDFVIPSNVPAGSKIEVMYEVYGPHALTSTKCFGLKESGDADYSIPPDHCPSGGHCSFVGAESQARRDGHIDIEWRVGGGYLAAQSGVDTIRLPEQVYQGFGMSVCIKVIWPDGSIHLYDGRHIWFHLSDQGKLPYHLGEFPPVG